MRRIDELHLNFPFAGSRMLRDLLAGEGFAVGRLHVATLMKRMGIEALYRRPSTSKPAPGHKIYPYLLRNLEVLRPDQVWSTDITYIPLSSIRIFVPSLAILGDWYSRYVLAWRLSNTLTGAFCLEALDEALSSEGTAGDLQQRPGEPSSPAPGVHRGRLESAQALVMSWMAQRPGAGQRVRRAAVAKR